MASAPLKEIVVHDSLQLLTNEWVLREQLRKNGDKYEPIQPLDSLKLVLFDDYTYQLIRQNSRSNAINGNETVEWGKWKMNADRGLISVQVTNVDGRSILSAMLYRWQIEKLTPQQLVLNQFGFGDHYLVFERIQ